MVTLQFDGQFHEHVPCGYDNDQPNLARAGLMGYGWLIYQDTRQIARGWGAFAQGKNAASNIAEYLALIEGLEALLDINIKDQKVEVRGDARGVIDQMAGLAPVHSQNTLPFFRRAKRLAVHYAWLQWVCIPRRSNKNADYLSRKAIRQMHSIPGAYRNAIETIVPGWSKLLPVIDLRIYQPIQA